MAGGDCRLQFVPNGDGPGGEALESTITQLEDLLQPSKRISAEAVKLLPPTHSGKFRLTGRV